MVSSLKFWAHIIKYFLVQIQLLSIIFLSFIRLEKYILAIDCSDSIINYFFFKLKAFQKESNYLEQAMQIYTEIIYKKQFYFYYNELYWYIPLKSPYVSISYDKIPLPGTGNGIKKIN